MGLLGLIGNAVSTVGNVITHIGKTIGSEALTNFGKSVSGFGESIGQGSSSSGDDSSDSTDEDSSQGRSGRKRKKQLEPELPPDVEDGLLKYLHEPEEIFPDFMTLWHVSEQNERALEVARHLSIFGLPIVQGITAAEYLTRFAWHIWDEEDDAAALRVVEMAWENYRADFAMARRDKKGDVIPDRVPVKGDYREMQILRDVPFDGHTLNQDSNGTNVDNRTVEEIQGDIQETYNVSIEDDVPLNLEAARNYERALGEVASLFADVLDLPDLTTKQKGKLFQLILGSLTIKRTSRTQAEAETGADTKGARGYNDGDTIYDIFDSADDSAMSVLNFAHELLHSLHEFSALGGDNSPLNSLYENGLEAMDAIDTELLGNSVVLDDVEADYGLRIRGDYNGYNYNDGGPTFRQSFFWNDTEETVVDATMYAAFGLFDGIKDTFRDNLYDQLELSIRNSILHNMELAAQVDFFTEQGFLQENGEAATNYGNATVTFSGNGYIRRYNGEEFVRQDGGPFTEHNEKYPVLGTYTDEATRGVYIATLRDGRIVWIDTNNLNLEDVSSAPDLELGSPTDMTFTFDPLSSLEDVPFPISLIEQIEDED